MKRRLSLVIVAFCSLCFLAFSSPLQADDWPQFRGPNRDDISKETGLLKTWPKDGPPLRWTFTNAGVGYSGPAIVRDRLYTMGAHSNTEYVFALDVQTGKELWSAEIGPKFTWKGNEWNAGPAATPTVDGDLVYALGGQGILICVEAASGKEHWRKDLSKDLAAEVNPIGGAPENIGWGFNWSPLVDSDKLICVPGGPQGTMAALDKKTGVVIWRSKDYTERASYSSPILAEVGGVRHYIQITNGGITGVAAADGRRLWHYAKNYPAVLIPTPIFHDDCVYATAAQAGCDLVKLTAKGQQIKAAKVYADKNMDNRDGGVLLVNGHVYGYSESRGKAWMCQDFKTGRVNGTERRRLKRGSLTYADGRLYCYGEEDGTVVLVDPAPETWTHAGWTEHGRFTIPRHSVAPLRQISGRVWTHPVVANGQLYLRDQELIFCFDVKEQRAK